MPCNRGLSLHRGPVGEPGGDSFSGGFFKEEKKYIWFPFLDLEDIKILSLGTIWNFGKGTELSCADIRFWGTKDPYIKPRCSGTIRAQSQCIAIYLALYDLLYRYVPLCTMAHSHST
jgi:hypothetical protein